jgi:hypothetical protein
MLLCMGLFSIFLFWALPCIAETGFFTSPNGRGVQASRLMATISLPAALMRAMAAPVFSIAVAM